MQLNAEQKSSKPFSAGAVVLLLLLALALLTPLTARYVIGDAAGDTARVAKFDVTVRGGSSVEKLVGDLSTFDDTFMVEELSPQGSATQYYLQVQNKGETTVKFTALLTTEGNLPLDYKYAECVTGEGAAGEETACDKTSDGTQDYFTGTVAPGSTSTYRISAAWASGANGYAYSNGVAAVQLNVQVEQVD
jgi:hypothetical protein